MCLFFVIGPIRSPCEASLSQVAGRHHISNLCGWLVAWIPHSSYIDKTAKEVLKNKLLHIVKALSSVPVLGEPHLTSNVKQVRLHCKKQAFRNVDPRKSSSEFYLIFYFIHFGRSLITFPLPPSLSMEPHITTKTHFFHILLEQVPRPLLISTNRQRLEERFNIPKDLWLDLGMSMTEQVRLPEIGWNSPPLLYSQISYFQPKRAIPFLLGYIKGTGLIFFPQ